MDKEPVADSGHSNDTAPLLDSGTETDIPDALDEDGDGYPHTTDCDDGNASIHPGALDWCGDEVDQNCNGTIDDSMCAITTEQMHHIAGTVSNGGFGKQVRHIPNSAVSQNDQILISANFTPSGTLYQSSLTEIPTHNDDSSLNPIELSNTQMFGTIILEPNGTRNTDINHDGWNDWIVSSPTTSNDVGQVHIYSDFDRSTPSHSIAWDTGEDVGKSLEVIDWNGDGVLDIVIGDARHDGNGVDAGAIAIHLLNSTLPTLSNVRPENIVMGEQSSDLFGQTLSNIGDINGDGLHDLAVSAPRSSGSQNLHHSGRVVIFLSDNGALDFTPDLFVDGTLEDGLLGSSISVLGDVNNDGVLDVGIGARNARGSGVGYILSTSDLLGCQSACGITDIAVAEISVSDPESQFGRSWIPLGDINQDGISDFGVGAKRANIMNDDTGAMYLYFGPITGTIDNLYHGRISGKDAFTQLTVSTTTADVDGDGRTDILFGGREERLVEQGTIDDGNVYILTSEALFSE